MAFHIPFNQRHSKPTGPPVYIGFDRALEPRPRRKFNWWGFHGLWTSLLALTSAGLLSPLSLLISANGLRKKKGPRKAAVAGTIISLAGIALAGAIVSTIVHGQHRQHHRTQQSRLAAVAARQRSDAQQLLVTASRELEQYRASHNGFLPSVIDSNMLVIKHKDPWGEELRFDVNGNDASVVRSAGPDMVFETPDDLVRPVKGKVEAEASLLPL